MKKDRMTILATRQRRPRRKKDEDLVKLERLSARLVPEVDGAAVTADEINRLIDEDRRVRYQERVAARERSRRTAQGTA